MPGKFWVIEGSDGVGKSTQTELLKQKLEKSAALLGSKVIKWHFPHYEGSPWGSLIEEYLSGDLGTPEMTGPYYSGLLYAGDRGQQAAQIKQTLAEGNWVIADRYFPSNLAYQGAHIADPIKREHFFSWLNNVEQQYFQIVQPTGIIVLTLDTEEAGRRIVARGEKMDIYERNQPYLAQVAVLYQRLAERYGWPIVPCKKDGQLLDPELIAEKIWQIIHTP